VQAVQADGGALLLFIGVLNGSHSTSSSLKRHLAPLSPFAFAIDRNAMVAAERTHSRLDPSVAPAGRLADTIEEPRDLPIGHLSRQLVDQRQGILGYRPTVLADRILFELQRSGVTALPMQDHLDMIALT
jgi:hypothetical protein